MTTKLKLGSLFSGSGGFELAGALHGIEPVWASEIEPFPIRVTKLRFPHMKHLGSVTEINGAEIEPVDIITFGSPCQDLSVAGKQKGIHDGERSNLFFEAVRIIREMREHDRAIGRADVDLRPRFAVWENVPGAFSSNHGADFQAVLQALCEIEGGCGVSIPMPPKGKWLPAGCVVGDGYSVAWRVYDAQFGGVPQRRKRIYLIADFGSECAGEILFERESVPGDTQTGRETRERAADDAERSAGRSDFVKCLNPWDCQSKRQYSVDGVYRTLDAGNCIGGQAHGICYPAAFMGDQGAKTWKGTAADAERDIGESDNACGCDLYNGQLTGDKTATLNANSGASANHAGPSVLQPLRTVPNSGDTVPDMVYAMEGNTVDRASKKNGKGWCENVSLTLNTQDKHAVTYSPVGNHCGKGGDAFLALYENHSQDSRYTGPCEVAQTVSATYGMGGNNQPFVVKRIEHE